MMLPRVRFTVRRLLLATVGIAALIRSTPELWSLATLDFIDDGYALWGAAEMVEDYMEDHAGGWPRGWDDLKPNFDAGGGRVGGWSFGKYQRRVRIDFAADVEDLGARAKAHDRATFRVIWAANLLTSKMGGRDPNQLLHAYLRDRPPRRTPPRRRARAAEPAD